MHKIVDRRPNAGQFIYYQKCLICNKDLRFDIRKLPKNISIWKGGDIL